MNLPLSSKIDSSQLIIENYKEWISELDFILDEISIFEELVNSHFIELCSFDLYNKSKKLIHQLEFNEIDVNNLKSEIYTQQKYLSLFLESNNINRKDEFILKYYEINETKYSYMNNFKDLKKDTYSLIKEILIRNKQKKLINNDKI